jgi:hypothetical protein
MSSIIMNQDNLTSTSNLRSEKSAAKKRKTKKSEIVKSVTMESDVVSSLDENNISSVVSVEPNNTVTNCDSITAPVSQDDTNDIADLNANTSAQTILVAEAPVLNVWQLRQQVKDAAEALDKANKLNAALMAKLNEQSNYVPKVITKNTSAPPTTPATPATPAILSNSHDSDGFTLVQRKQNVKKPFQNKVQVGGAKKTDTSVNHNSTNSNAASSATTSASKKSYVSKPVYKSPSAEDIAYRARKGIAFDTAQNTVIAECINVFKGKPTDDINTGLQHIKDYRRTLIVRYDSDDVCVEVEDEKFVFSRTQFLMNRFFQNKVRDLTNELVPDAWIRFFPGRDEGTFCMGVQKRNE